MEEFQLIAQKVNFQTPLYQEGANKKIFEKSSLIRPKK